LSLPPKAAKKPAYSVKKIFERNTIIMNKTKKVAWHKHLAKAKKLRDRQKLAQKSGTSAPVASGRR
jgi:hypothetical protein